MNCSISSYSDQELISRYISGDERSLGMLVSRYKDDLYRFIFSKTYNENLTDDVFQETFLKVVNALKNRTYEDQGKFKSWIMRVANNLLLDKYKKKKRIYCYDDSDILDAFIHENDSPDLNTSEIERDMIKSQDYEVLMKFVNELPKELKSVVHLRIFEGLTFKQISETHGISINTATGRMRYALRNLRKKISINPSFFMN